MPTNRRKFIRNSLLILGLLWESFAYLGWTTTIPQIISKFNHKRVRPSDAAWPSLEKWEQLKNSLTGDLIKIESPFKVCGMKGDKAPCATLFKNLKNPYFIGDNPALTQTLGWFKGWKSEPSAYAVAAQNVADVAAAVNFARIHNLRLVIKGGAIVIKALPLRQIPYLFGREDEWYNPSRSVCGQRLRGHPRTTTCRNR